MNDLKLKISNHRIFRHFNDAKLRKSFRICKPKCPSWRAKHPQGRKKRVPLSGTLPCMLSPFRGPGGFWLFI